jgi:fucose permease
MVSLKDLTDFTDKNKYIIIGVIVVLVLIVLFLINESSIEKLTPSSMMKQSKNIIVDMVNAIHDKQKINLGSN